MSSALVLNITEDPLSVVAAKRAAILVMEGKADVVCPSDLKLNSEHLSIDVPSIIRLKYYVRISYERPRTISRRSIFARDGHRCQYCGDRADSIDHIVPKSKGGKHVWENVVAACKSCNSKKQDYMLKETSLKLMCQPKTPGIFTRLLLSGREAPDHWQPYLKNGVA